VVPPALASAWATRSNACLILMLYVAKSGGVAFSASLAWSYSSLAWASSSATLAGVVVLVLPPPDGVVDGVEVDGLLCDEPGAAGPDPGVVGESDPTTVEKSIFEFGKAALRAPSSVRERTMLSPYASVT